MDRGEAPGKLVVRLAGVGDVEAVAALVESAYRGESSRRGWTTEADLLDGQRTDAGEVGELVRSRDHSVLCAFRDGALVGCCDVSRHDDRGHFAMFAVRPERQGAGIGSTLLARAEATVVRWGCRTMRMWVISARTDLLAWYGRRGYEETGTSEPFPYGDERFGVPRREGLELVEIQRTLV